MIEDNDIILSQAVKILTPFILVFGVYVTFHGHLTPGGGFSGGTIMAAALILNRISNQNVKYVLKTDTLLKIVSAALIAYGVIKAMGTFFPHQMHSVIPTGTPGNLFSGGTILPLNISVGAVVACVMYIFFSLIGEDS